MKSGRADFVRTAPCKALVDYLLLIYLAPKGGNKMDGFVVTNDR